MSGSYRQLLSDTVFSERIACLNAALVHCNLCPRRCEIDRTSGQKGYCKTARNAVVSSCCAHHGEEPPISGRGGSGTIFFAHCNLHCRFCQNYDISQGGYGEAVTTAELADMMITLQDKGCHNINLVSPSHVIPQIIEAVQIASKKGLSIPLVYNSNGYDSVKTLRLLEGIIDIYLPDLKYGSNKAGMELSDCADYWDVAQAALVEMYRQVGELLVDNKGVARKGLLVRHLVLPDNYAGSREAFTFIAREISVRTHVSIMAQYHPCYMARDDKKIGRTLERLEYEQVLDIIHELGFENAFCQELSSSGVFLPNFKNADPFKETK